MEVTISKTQNTLTVDGTEYSARPTHSTCKGCAFFGEANSKSFIRCTLKVDKKYCTKYTGRKHDVSVVWERKDPPKNENT